MLLEVIVQSVADAKAAEAGGADRLEVVRDIERDGLTPSIDLVRAIAAETRLPLRVMVRESEGFSVAGPHELRLLRNAIAAFAALPVDGAVLGFAREGELDLENTQALLAAAPALPVTFHRAFDSARDPAVALHALRQLSQIDRILTDGGGADAARRSQRWQQYVAHAGNRLIIVAGGGVDEGTLRMLASTGAVKEVHVGRAARDPQIPTAPVSAACVRRLKNIACG